MILSPEFWLWCALVAAVIALCLALDARDEDQRDARRRNRRR